MIIRQETKSDFQEVYNLVKVDFETAHVASGNEQDFMESLKKTCNFIPELSLVAEENKRLIAHVMLTKIAVIDGDQKQQALLLAPVSVELAHRNKRVGSEM